MNPEIAAVLVAAAAVLATLAGGLLALRSGDRMHLVLGLSGGLLLGLVAFDLLPEVFGHETGKWFGVPAPALALVVGFMSLHVVERAFGQHEPLDSEFGHDHAHSHHAAAGTIGAIALSLHVFLDGVAIAISFRISTSLGLAVAIAVLGHAFSDGLNTVALLSGGDDVARKGKRLLALDALSRISGAVIGGTIALSEGLVDLYLAAFAGALVYLATSHILPEAHSHHPSRMTLLSTIAGLCAMLLIVVGTSGLH